MKSARQIGEIVNLTAREVNKFLHEKGLLDGTPGNWNLTESGKKYGEIRKKDNNEGGYALKKWQFPMWEDKVINKFLNKKQGKHSKNQRFRISHLLIRLKIDSVHI